MTARSVVLAALGALALTGCSSGSHNGQPHPGTIRGGAPQITPVDGAMAVFRAKVSPILCSYARNLQTAEREIANASADAEGAINASAPENAQSEYASAMANLARALHDAVSEFRSVNPPATLAEDYRSFISTLSLVRDDASRAAGYAAARNYAEIAAMENTPTPTAGEGVFHRAGITGCGPSS